MLIKSVSRCQDSSNLPTNVLRNPTLEIYKCQQFLYRTFLLNSFVSHFTWNLQLSIWQHTKGEGNFFVRPLSLFFFFNMPSFCCHVFWQSTTDRKVLKLTGKHMIRSTEVPHVVSKILVFFNFTGQFYRLEAVLLIHVLLSIKITFVLFDFPCFGNFRKVLWP